MTSKLQQEIIIKKLEATNELITWYEKEETLECEEIFSKYILLQ